MCPMLSNAFKKLAIIQHLLTIVNLYLVSSDSLWSSRRNMSNIDINDSLPCILYIVPAGIRLVWLFVIEYVLCGLLLIIIQYCLFPYVTFAHIISISYGDALSSKTQKSICWLWSRDE